MWFFHSKVEELHRDLLMFGHFSVFGPGKDPRKHKAHSQRPLRGDQDEISFTQHEPDLIYLESLSALGTGLEQPFISCYPVRAL